MDRNTKQRILRNTLALALGCFVLFIALMAAGFVAVNNGWTNVGGIIDTNFSTSTSRGQLTSSISGGWSKGEEWETFRIAVIKDKAHIDRAAALTGVPARLIMANVAVEQLRLFHTERAVYKQFFAPLKILGNQVQFSWGVAGLKQATAAEIERNLTDSASPYYLGPELEHTLDYKPGENRDEALFLRLTNDDNQYYSYLYAGLYLRQVAEQWERAGYPILERPEIMGTLFNIGFAHSSPKANPQVGGAAIAIKDMEYSFGGLVSEIYYSNELLVEFPR